MSVDSFQYFYFKLLYTSSSLHLSLSYTSQLLHRGGCPATNHMLITDLACDPLLKTMCNWGPLSSLQWFTHRNAPSKCCEEILSRQPWWFLSEYNWELMICAAGDWWTRLLRCTQQRSGLICWWTYCQCVHRLVELETWWWRQSAYYKWNYKKMYVHKCLKTKICFI